MLVPGQASPARRRFAARLRRDYVELKQALRTWKFYNTLLMMLIGITLMSVALNGIAAPRNFFAPGGAGLALMVYYIFGQPSVGAIYFLLNLPLFVLGWREYALKYILISLIGVVMFSVALYVTEDLFIFTPDPVIAAIITGVMMGFGAGLYLRVGGSAGGLDILAVILKKRLALPVGTTFITINAINLLGAWLVFDLTVAFYSALFMWVNSWTMERVQTGFSQRRAVFIITSKPEAVAERVMRRLDRGVTFFHASGGYTQEALKVVYSVINMVELGRLKDLLFEIDPDAFVAVYNTSEVIGRQFLTWEDEGYRRPVEWPTGSATLP